jgi:uncharacterized protein involved in exopolysaccharide biosynthesis
MDTPEIGLEISKTSLRDFLHVLFKRKIQILLFFGVTVCTVAIGTAITKPTYDFSEPKLQAIHLWTNQY